MIGATGTTKEAVLLIGVEQTAADPARETCHDSPLTPLANQPYPVPGSFTERYSEAGEFWQPCTETGGPAVANPNLRWDGQSWFRWTGTEWMPDPSLPPPGDERLESVPPEASSETSDTQTLGTATGKSKAPWVIGGIALAIAAAGVAFVATRGTGGSTSVDSTGQPSQPPLAPTTSDVVALVTFSDTTDGFLQTSAAGALPPVEPQSGEEFVVGDTPGLYGGLPGQPQCDLRALRDGVVASGFDAEWSRLVGSRPKTYLSGKTSAVLLRDTYLSRWVLADGETEYQLAVLQAGTPVMVDNDGLPVLSCVNGSPLTRATTPFAPSSVDRAAQWDGYRKSRVTTVEPSPFALDKLDLEDPQTGEQFVRPVGTQGEADSPIADSVNPSVSPGVGLPNPDGPTATASQ